jgi:hypothetical protein
VYNDDCGRRPEDALPCDGTCAAEIQATLACLTDVHDGDVCSFGILSCLTSIDCDSECAALMQCGG